MNIDVEEFSKFASKTFDDIDMSANFVSVYTSNFRKSPLCALQIGYAIITNKPIYLLAEKGEVIPERLSAIATAVEYFERSNNDSLKQAVDKIAKQIS